MYNEKLIKGIATAIMIAAVAFATKGKLNVLELPPGETIPVALIAISTYIKGLFTDKPKPH